MTGPPVPNTMQLIFAALSDESRREVLKQLVDGTSSASRLSTPLGISRQAVARHLRILVDAGLVTRHRDGREIVFEFVERGLEPAKNYIEALDGAARGNQFAGGGAGPPSASAESGMFG